MQQLGSPRRQQLQQQQAPQYSPQPQQPQLPFGHNQQFSSLQVEHGEEEGEEGGDYLHYCQNQLSPRSRSDYDAFNRAHFERLQSAQGRASKRAVTPKVWG